MIMINSDWVLFVLFSWFDHVVSPSIRLWRLETRPSIHGWAFRKVKLCNAAWFSVPFRRQRSVVRGPVGWGKGVEGGGVRRESGGCWGT